MRLLSVLLSLTLLSSSLAAQSLSDIGTIGDNVTVNLTNGDVISGRLIENTGTAVVLSHDVFGDITLPRTVIVIPEPPADDVFVETPWGGTADVSMIGNSGNTNNLSLHGEINMRQETVDAVDSILVTADQRSERVAEPAPSTGTDRKVTDRRRYARFRKEWKMEESRWRPFFEVSTSHNFLRDYNELVTVGGGAGYLFTDEADETLIGRLGLSETKRFGASKKSEEHWTLEALVGLDYRLDITERQHLAAETTMFPALADLGEFRSVSKVEWRLDLSDDSPWYYKLGLTHNYDSQVSKPTKKSDVNYYAGVGTVF